jgi:hypothetical protein
VYGLEIGGGGGGVDHVVWSVAGAGGWGVKGLGGWGGGAGRCSSGQDHGSGSDGGSVWGSGRHSRLFNRESRYSTVHRPGFKIHNTGIEIPRPGLWILIPVLWILILESCTLIPSFAELDYLPAGGSSQGGRARGALGVGGGFVDIESPAWWILILVVSISIPVLWILNPVLWIYMPSSWILFPLFADLDDRSVHRRARWRLRDWWDGKWVAAVWEWSVGVRRRGGRGG